MEKKELDIKRAVQLMEFFAEQSNGQSMEFRVKIYVNGEYLVETPNGTTSMKGILPSYFPIAPGTTKTFEYLDGNA